jgi:flavorubredoxin
MKDSGNSHKSYDHPIEIADRIYWVGFDDQISNFHCNPYLVVEGDQAVLIDAGSRPDFAVVMMKILQTGISPEQITALVYHHPDPDLCGSMSNVVDICANSELKILSESDNNIFLSYYIERGSHNLIKSLGEYGHSFNFRGRTLKFLKTPYAHSSGSFVTYDERTKTLFTSDLFGCVSNPWDLFIKLETECHACRDYGHCVLRMEYCPVKDILEFHKKMIPSGKALKYAMDVIRSLDVQMIAPQHGSVFTEKKDIDFLIKCLCSLRGVGIDGI